MVPLLSADAISVPPQPSYTATAVAKGNPSDDYDSMSSQWFIVSDMGLAAYSGNDGINVPTLILVGDEDDPCLQPSFFLKQWIASSGLAVFPKTGHVVNQEEPAAFNEAVADFIARVEAGRWPVRDPRSYRK